MTYLQEKTETDTADGSQFRHPSAYEILPSQNTFQSWLYFWIISELCSAFFYKTRVLWQGISMLNVVKYLKAESRKCFFFSV